MKSIGGACLFIKLDILRMNSSEVRLWVSREGLLHMQKTRYLVILWSLSHTMWILRTHTCGPPRPPSQERSPTWQVFWCTVISWTWSSTPHVGQCPLPQFDSKYLRLSWPGFYIQVAKLLYTRNNTSLVTTAIKKTHLSLHLVNRSPQNKRNILWTPKLAKAPLKIIDLIFPALIQAHPNSAHPCLPGLGASQTCTQGSHVARKLLLLCLFFKESNSVRSQLPGHR